MSDKELTSREEGTPTVPNLLEAAHAALRLLDSLLPLRPSDDLPPAPEQTTKINLRAALESYSAEATNTVARMPLSPVDTAINNLLARQSRLIRFRDWLEAHRELLDAHLPRRFHSITMDRYSNDLCDVTIHGAVRPVELAKALGGKWKKVVGYEGKHFDFACEELPRLFVKCTIHNAEPRVVQPETPLESEVFA